MRLVIGSALAAALATFAPTFISAAGQDAARAVKDGGITVPGWQGRIDVSEEKAGLTLNNARLAAAPGGAMKVTTGPAVAYWSPKNVATGNYTVKATFNEAEYMGLNDHPHPY